MRLVQQLTSIPELKEFIEINILPRLRAKQIILLDGPMGAGKTEFVKQLVELLGGEAATSPSFALHNTYETNKFCIEHLDLFRLDSEEDLHSIGFWDLFENDKNIIIVEWASKVSVRHLPLTWSKLAINFKILNMDTRELSLEA